MSAAVAGLAAPPRVEVRRGVLAPALLAGLLLAALAPVALVEIPAMVDYPNHLARMSILARSGTAAAHPHYEVAWGFYPNLAMDLLVPPLVGPLGVEAATRLFLVLGLVLVATGSVAIELATKRRLDVAGFAAVAVLYAAPMAWGFLNFTFALGLALWALAASVATQGRDLRVRAALHLAIVPALYVCHLFALGVFGAAVGALELWRLRSGRTSWASAAAIGLAMALPLAALLAATTSAGGSVGGEGLVWGLDVKLLWPFFVNGWSLPASLLAAALLVLRLSALAKGGLVRLTPPGASLAATFGLLYLVLPFRLLDTAYVDVRVLVAAALILPAFVEIRRTGAARRRAAWGVAGIVGLNLLVVGAVQAGYRTEYARLVASFDHLGRGARVLVGHVRDAPDPPWWNMPEYPMYHAPLLAAHYADAFVPTLFTYRGKQPLRPRAHVAGLALDQGSPEGMDTLRAASGFGDKVGLPVHVANWTRDFDFLYVVGPPGANPLPERLQALAAGERFALYRIVKR